MEKFISMILTESCNLKCSYCYEHHRSEGKMPKELAKDIIAKELNSDDDTDTVFIEFFGGEPFLEFDLIRELHDYTVSHKWPKNHILFTTTNGTLVHGIIKDWLEKNKNTFCCGLSLDGTKEMHDHNRCGSFDKIDIDFFKQMWPNQSVKMTISPYTLNHLSDGIMFLHNKGFDVSCNLAYGCDWRISDHKKILERELSVLIDFYIEHPNIRVCSILDMSIDDIKSENVEYIRKWCGAGTKMKAYAIDGTVYPCQLFSPISIGNKMAYDAQKIEFCEDIEVSKLDIKCRNCPFVDVCPTCCGYNFLQYGSIYMKDAVLCELTKVMFYATSYLKAYQISNNQLALHNDELFRLIDGIKKIQSYL